MFLTHDLTHLTEKQKNLDPTQLNPTQPVGRPNPWTTLIWLELFIIGMLVSGDGQEQKEVDGSWIVKHSKRVSR